MLFNTTTFAGFFVVVFGLYLVASENVRRQNVLLLVASYFFYGWWDYRFLALLATSTTVDYFVSRRISVSASLKTRRRLLLLSICVNLGILGFFKYFNFFSESITAGLAQFGIEAPPRTLSLILPVGISFYTFQTLGYTVDVYRNRIQPCRRIIDFALFVSFFPQLVAGPIERAGRLLPQISMPRQLTAGQAQAGLHLIVWGLFKKMVIADNLAVISDPVFDSSYELRGFTLTVGALAFAFQIYCDFSGYTDIARGLCKLLGFDLTTNFRLPYFATNPSEFWRRWHVSLSEWLRDYLYIPLGGNRRGRIRVYLNLLITMVLGGLWHGAAWNFIAWGGFHGTVLGLHRFVSNTKLVGRCRSFGAAWTFAAVGITFYLNLIGWVFFRSESVGQAFYILRNWSIWPTLETLHLWGPVLVLVAPLLVIEWYQQRKRNLLVVTQWSKLNQSVFHAALIIAIFAVGAHGLDAQPFVYFQF